MLNTPKISVLMSIYNEDELWIRQAIDSILNQTFGNFEFIIINDNPNYEQNNKLITSYQEQDARIKYFINEQNIGLTKTLNKGLNIACGDYIARMDADDIAMPHRFEEQYTFLSKNKEYVGCGTLVNFIDSKGTFLKLNKRATNYESLKLNMILANNVMHPTIMFSKKHIIDTGIKYREEYIRAQDYQFVWELISSGKFCNLDKAFLNYRVRDGKITARSYFSEQKGYAEIINGGIFTQCIKKLIGKEKIEINSITTLKAIKNHKSITVEEKRLRDFLILRYLMASSNKLLMGKELFNILKAKYLSLGLKLRYIKRIIK